MSSEERKSKATDCIEFYAGLFLLVAGLFFILKRATVSTFSFYSFSIGGYNISSGLVVIPLIIGVVWWFYNPKSKLAKFLTAIGGILIISAIIMSLRITFQTTSLFDYVVMLLLMASGVGLLLRAFFNKNK